MLLTFVFVLILGQAHASLRFSTFNVRNFDKEETRVSRIELRTDKDKLYQLIKETKADVMAIQEIFDEVSFKQFTKDYLQEYELILSKCGGSGKQKLGFLYKKSSISLVSYHEEASISMSPDCHVGLRPALVAKFKSTLDKHQFHALSVHLKAGDKPEDEDKRLKQLELIDGMVKSLTLKGDSHIIIMGDFNTTGFVAKNNEYDNFLKFTQKIKAVSFSQSLKCTSYWQVDKNKDLFKGSLLDHIIISDSLSAKYKSKKVEVLSHCKALSCGDSEEADLGLTYENVSDHCPVVSELK